MPLADPAKDLKLAADSNSLPLASCMATSWLSQQIKSDKLSTYIFLFRITASLSGMNPTQSQISSITLQVWSFSFFIGEIDKAT